MNISESVKLDDGPPARYQLRADRVNLDRLSDEESNLRRFTVGNRDHKYPNKTILLVGATGSGKSTLINALVNFVMGVKFKDKVWFEIVPEEKNRPQTETQTTAVSVYEVFGFEGKTVPYSLTIIDTPGYGDTRGIESDDDITKKLQELFCVPDGVKTINAVGLVLKSTENRLDERMAYIFNSVTSLFGRDMEQNIVALMTHSDGMKPNHALQALDEAKVKFARDENNEPVYFLFNNRQKEKLEEGKAADRAARFAFDTSGDGMEQFTDFLGERPPMSMQTTVEVMKERIRLKACIQNLEERVRTIEIKQNAINKNKEELTKYEAEMKKNKDFTIDVEKVYKEKKDIQKAGQWLFADNRATTCKKCKENCHYPGCTVAPNPGWCEVMRNGKCTSCSGKCPVEAHVKEDWIYVTKTKTVKKTYKEMKAKYDENKTQSEKKTSLLEDLEKEILTLHQQKKQDLDEAFQIIEKLEQISLNVDSVFTYVHLEFLMEKMKEIGDTEKVQKLERMKDQIEEKNKAAANYFRKCIDYVKNKKGQVQYIFGKVTHMFSKTGSQV